MTWKRLVHLSVGAALHVAIILTLLSLPGCPRADLPGPEAPMRLQDVPTIRVLVASGRRIRLATSGPYALLVDGREVARSMDPLPEGFLSRNKNVWSIHAASYPARALTVVTIDQPGRRAFAAVGAGRSCVRVGSTSYRGNVVFHPDRGDGMLAVNHVNLESYLAGVLACELGARWHVRTYQAQAIAARTYALYEMAAAGRRPYHLRDDQSSQVYRGFSAETDKSWRAVRSTRGIVLAAGAEGQEEIFRAHYSSCCGGSANSVYVLYGPPVTSGPLAGGRSCDECSRCPRYRWPPVTVAKGVIHRALLRQYPQLAELRAVKTVEVVEEVKGRPVWVDVVGLGGRKARIRADDLRLSLLRDGDASAQRLYSMNCRIRDAGRTIVFEQGSGFGHGVGLCQWGAQGKAEQGAAPQQILADYYPTAKLFRAY